MSYERDLVIREKKERCTIKTQFKSKYIFKKIKHCLLGVLKPFLLENTLL